MLSSSCGRTTSKADLLTKTKLVKTCRAKIKLVKTCFKIALRGFRLLLIICSYFVKELLTKYKQDRNKQLFHIPIPILFFYPPSTSGIAPCVGTTWKWYRRHILAKPCLAALGLVLILGRLFAQIWGLCVACPT